MVETVKTSDVNQLSTKLKLESLAELQKQCCLTDNIAFTALFDKIQTKYTQVNEKQECGHRRGG